MLNRATGKPKEAWNGANNIWLNGYFLLESCSKLFGFWDQAGENSPLATIERILLAVKESSIALVNYLSKQLPAEYQTIGNALSALQDNSVILPDFARNVSFTDLTRQAMQIVFAYLARTDVGNACSLIPIVAKA
ncbi:hypothetical protein [Sodalis-like endosymbiont of Proechinophthirus fluctus]|uniref:hypothetical protein n=1 Tax=Sodalis-like endosymbiont of Proechinophthirus fluctus TaxID=1462730 RepID=UPI000830CE95|nr:hypothetical protein [Sodalis-like endosymbiont of Proechinophthirus fluctus]